MQYYKIKDIGSVVTGATPKTGVEEFWNGENLWITPAEISESTKYIYNTERKLTAKGIKSASLTLLPKNTVLLSSRAPIGKVAIAGTSMYCNQGFKNIICNPKIVSNEYLYYWLSSNSEYLNSLGRGATFKEISKSIVDEIEVPIPSIKNQIKIAKVLDKAQSLIDKRKKQIEDCDELIKSRFIEMFGVLDSNEKRFECAALRELCNKITDGKHGGCEREEGSGYYFVGAREIYDGAIHYESAPEIGFTDFEKDYKRCNVEDGDLLIVNTGATIGKSAIAVDNRTKNTLLQKSVALIKTNKEVLLPIFLQYCYKVNKKMYLVESSSAQPNLLLSKINETVIYIPPIELQRRFASFAQQVDKSKFALQKSLKEMEDNFNSIMQKAFKGELFPEE